MQEVPTIPINCKWWQQSALMYKLQHSKNVCTPHEVRSINSVSDKYDKIYRL